MAEEENSEIDVDVDVDTDGPGAEVEVEASSNESEDFSDNSAEDQYRKAETSTQKRIDRLTKKMRDAERREQEAIRYAQAVQNESNQIKNRLDALDTNYVAEYTSRVSTQIEQAESELARAIDLGDSAATVEAQRKLTNLAIQADRAAQAKAQQQRTRQQLEAQRAYAAKYGQPQQPQAPKRPDAKAEQWALRNSWFGQDEAMTYAAFGIHKTLVEDEGFDPQSEDYYTELDRRISDKFGNGASNSGKRPAQTVAGASRSTSGRSGKQVRLTPSQVTIAKKLGVPLKEYAKYVKE